MNSYYVGNQVRSTATFLTALNVAVDPTVVKVQVRTPTGVVSTLTYGTDLAVVKSAVGVYYTDVDASEVGEWGVRWYSTGSGQAASESGFVVPATKFS